MVNSLNLHAQDEVNQLYNDVDQVELTKKEQLYQQLRGVFPSGSEEKKVADFFSEKEIQQLYVTIRVSYLRDSQVLKRI